MNRRARRAAAKQAGKEAKATKRLVNKANNYDLIVFDITPTTIDTLPDTIRRCLASKARLKVFSSEGDNSNLELVEITHVKELYSRACLEYGLMEFFIANETLYPEGEAVEDYTQIALIAFGDIKEKDGTGATYNIDTRVLEHAGTISRDKYIELYGV